MINVNKEVMDKMAKAGDFILTQDNNPISEIIMTGEQGSFAHSAIVSGENTIIEAMPNGVVENPIHYERYAVFSVVNITDEQRQKAVNYAKSHIGEKYDYLQDVGFALNGLRELIGLKRIPDLWEEHGKIICSALVDMSYRDEGIILRSDRDAGDVTPTGLSFSTEVRLTENHNLWEL